MCLCETERNVESFMRNSERKGRKIKETAKTVEKQKKKNSEVLRKKEYLYIQQVSTRIFIYVYKYI